jgi:membrane protease YdiL (CAAX protease family)
MLAGMDGKRLAAALLAAAVIEWAIWAWRPAGFWVGIAAGSALLGLLALWLRRRWVRDAGPRQGDVALGLAAALALYAVFWAARLLLPRLSPAGPSQLAYLYALVAAAPWQLVAVLTARVVAPGEELFWRGLVLPAMRERGLAPWAAVGAAAGAYGAAHLFSGRALLALAAFAAGLAWGAMYQRLGRLAPVIVSHVLWDLAVLLFFPLR